MWVFPQAGRETATCKNLKIYFYRRYLNTQNCTSIFSLPALLSPPLGQMIFSQEKIKFTHIQQFPEERLRFNKSSQKFLALSIPLKRLQTSTTIPRRHPPYGAFLPTAGPSCCSHRHRPPRWIYTSRQVSSLLLPSCSHEACPHWIPSAV